MAYNKTIWKDQDVEKPRTYSVRDNGDDTVTLLDAFGTVTELGTPVNAENMNKIENELYSLDAAVATKQATITGAATTITGSNLTTNRALISNGSGKVAVSAVTSTELGYLDGVTSAIQTQIDGKQATVTGAATSVTSSNLTASRALVSNSNGKIAVATTTSTELGYVHGVTSAIQTQINAKQATITGAATTIAAADLTASRALISNSSGKVAVSSVTSTELGYLNGATSKIQTQINAKAADNAVVKLTGTQSVAGAKTFSDVCYGKASDAANSLLTTVNKSKNTNGYFQLGNGLIMQWGTSNGSGSRTVTFPKAFTSTNYTITGTSHGMSYVIVDVNSKTKTSVSMGNDVGFDWIAIGY